MLIGPLPPYFKQRFHDQLLLSLRHGRHPFDAGVLVGDSRLGQPIRPAVTCVDYPLLGFLKTFGCQFSHA